MAHDDANTSASADARREGSPGVIDIRANAKFFAAKTRQNICLSPPTSIIVIHVALRSTYCAHLQRHTMRHLPSRLWGPMKFWARQAHLLMIAITLFQVFRNTRYVFENFEEEVQVSQPQYALDVPKAVDEGRRRGIVILNDNHADVVPSEDEEDEDEESPQESPERIMELPLYPDTDDVDQENDNVNQELLDPPRESWSYTSSIFNDTCEPAFDWQVSQYPNCNSLHEVDLRDSTITGALHTSNHAYDSFQPHSKLETRALWAIRHSRRALMLSTVRKKQEMDEVDYERHRLSSMTYERLTSSPHVLNIFTYCGLSSITEQADDIDLQSLRDVTTPREKLIHARDLAQSIADLHNVTKHGLVHRNVSISKFSLVQGKLKLSNADDVWFMRTRRQGNVTVMPCSIPSIRERNRSPEEILDKNISEKIDVYGIGASLFSMLTSSEMYYCEDGKYCYLTNILGDDDIDRLKLTGIGPKLPETVENNTEPAITAIRKAMRSATSTNLAARPSAQAIAKSLRKALSSLLVHSRLSCPSFVGGNTNKTKYISSKSNARLFIAGLVRDASAMSADLFEKLVELNCRHGFGIQILAESGRNETMFRYKQDRRKYIDKKKRCASFDILNEPAEAAEIRNRVDRIAYLRDYQRDRLEIAFGGTVTEQDVILLIDFDLFSIPSVDEIKGEACKMVHRRDHDVVCAAGLMHRPFGYYDTFATILKPDTFVYPLKGRLKGSRRGENMNLVRSDDIYGTVTQERILAYFENEKHQTSNGAVPVRSCFGGMAFYRASKWFMPQCRYGLLDSPQLLEYANKEDGGPCEHVAFHLCLAKNDVSTQIVVQPRLRTFWDDPLDFGNRLESGGRIGGGLMNSNGLVTVKKRASEGSMLVNGDYRLRINEVGKLVVEHSLNMTTSEVIWSTDTNVDHFHENWINMFLILQNNGLLLLVQQVQQVHENLRSNGACQVVDDSATSCRIIVWSSGVEGPGGKEAGYFLELSNKGVLRIMDKSRKVLWAQYGRQLVERGDTKASSKEDKKPSTVFRASTTRRSDQTTRQQNFNSHPLMVQMDGESVSRIDPSQLLFHVGAAGASENDYPELNPQTEYSNSYYKDRFRREKMYEKGCVPRVDWMDDHHPSCLTFHELSLTEFSRGNKEQLRLIGRGTMRDAWLTRDVDGTKLALKTLYYGAIREYNRFAFDVHQIDATVMEQLASSPYTTNVHGFCSSSAIVQYGEGLLRDVFHHPRPTKDDLFRIAHNVAAAVADTHQYDDNGKATFADEDIKPDQFLLVDGVYKLNDFNQGRPLWRDPAGEQICEERTQTDGEYQSPESEQGTGEITEKADIYSLGYVFYFLLTGENPFHRMDPVQQQERRKMGTIPEIHDKSILTSTHPFDITVRKAMGMCLKYSPDDRPSAKEVAAFLLKALKNAGLEPFVAG